jgi:hypothetical protein
MLGLFQQAARLGSAMVGAGLMCWEDGQWEEAVEYYRSTVELEHIDSIAQIGSPAFVCWRTMKEEKKRIAHKHAGI